MPPAKTYLFTCQHFGFIVYGSTVLVGTTSIRCRNALDEKFDVPSNYRSWSMVRAVPHIRKCLTNLKVCHDGTDEHDPNFDVFQDIRIQSQNYYSTSQLNVMVMGYRGGVLRAQFCTNKINERKAAAPVIVAHTLEHRGKNFFCDGRWACGLGKYVESGGDQQAAQGGHGEGEGEEESGEISHKVVVNSLPAMDGYDRPLFNELCGRLISPRIFVRW